MNIQLIESKSVQYPLDTWTTREHLCLTSAVSQSGDQNWVAVSKTVRQLTTELNRPPDWYSTKNCAVQYTKLLEQFDTSKRKREKAEGNVYETPMEIVRNTLNKRRIEELKVILEEERSLYQQLKKDILLLESSNQLDNRLHQFWDEMVRDQKAEEEEAAKVKEFIREREEKIKVFQASTKAQTLKVHSTESSKKSLSPIKPPETQCLKKGTTGASETKVDDLKHQEKDLTDKSSLDVSTLASHDTDSLSVTKKSVSPLSRSEVGKVGDSTEIKSETKENESIKTNEDTMEDLKCDSSFEANIPLDYTSNLNAEMKEHELLQEHEKDINLMTDVAEDSIKRPKAEDNLLKVETKTSDDVTTKEERPSYVSDGRKGGDAGSGPTASVGVSDASALSGFDSPGGDVGRICPKKDTKDEYEFDDDASRESADMNSCYREYMGRTDRRKFSVGESVASPVVSESTPSSPASTNYGDDPEAEKLHRSWKRSIMLIWNDLAAHKNASIFLKPITEDKAPGYHSIVYRPIDLMTIKRSIENGTTRTTSDFQRDVMLMFLNAKMYNTADQFVYQMAEHMMNDAVDTIEEFISAQMLAKVVETPQKSLRRETRESSSKRVGEDSKRKRDEKDEVISVKRRKL